jgi:hypothetical protein
MFLPRKQTGCAARQLLPVREWGGLCDLRDSLSLGKSLTECSAMFVTDILTAKSFGVNRGRCQRGWSLESSKAQALESRLVLAGNVTATFSLASGLLTFTGDAANNDITINVDGVGDAIATGNGGTTINGMASLNTAISRWTCSAVLSSMAVMVLT